MMRFAIAVIGVITVMASSTVGAAGNPFPLDAEAEAWVQRTLQGMTLEQQIGQLLHPALGWSAPSSPEQVAERLQLIEDLHVGGFIIGSSAAADVIPILNQLQSASDVPLLISADFEAGVGRIWREDATIFPRQMALTATGDPESARIVGHWTAREAIACGVHWPLVPICDVNINPDNPIINIRSYGEDVQQVIDFATAFIEGCQSAGAIACAKHFPGHGDTAVDSHMDLAYVEADRERLESVEFPPFRAAVDAGVGSVMTSHIWFPAMMGDEGRIPATVSHNVLTGLLREDMGFQGIIVTDSMRMRGLTNLYGPGEAAIAAVQAGADAILVSADDRQAAAALLAAVASGEISAERIAQSAERILRAKAWLGLHHGATVDIDEALASLRLPEARAAARDLAQRAITALRDDRGQLPLQTSADRSVHHISLFDHYRGWQRDDLDVLTLGLSRRFGEVTRDIAFREPTRELVERFFDISEEMSDEEIALSHGLTPRRRAVIMEEARASDLVIVTAFVAIAANKGDVSLGEEQLTLLRELSTLDSPVVLVMLGSPYLVSDVPEFPCQILTFDRSRLMCEVIPGALAGEFPLTGSLPVTIPGHANRGDGLMIHAQRRRP